MNTLKTLVLMVILSGFLLLIGGYFGGSTGLTVALGISLMMNLGSYWFSDKIVLMMYRATEITREENSYIYDIVENLAMNAYLPMPRVYIIDNPTPNAFATGRNPQNAAVAVTTGILKILSKEELSGVIGHELAHVKNRDILTGTIAATLVSTITYLVHFFGFFMGGRNRDEDRNPIVDIALMILAPIAATLIQMAISRSREYAADADGSKIAGDPIYLANALRKLEMANQNYQYLEAEPATAHMFIVNPLSGKSFLKMFSTHPPIEERIFRLEEMAAGRR